MLPGLTEARKQLETAIRALEQCRDTTDSDVIFRNCILVRNQLVEITDGLYKNRRLKEMDPEGHKVGK